MHALDHLNCCPIFLLGTQEEHKQLFPMKRGTSSMASRRKIDLPVAKCYHKIESCKREGRR